MRRNVRDASVPTALTPTRGLLVSPAQSATTTHPTNGFARSGPWNTKLPRHVPLAPNSTATVANIKQDKDENWSACWDGTIEHYSRDPGILTNPLGAAATGLTFGDIPVDRLRALPLDHGEPTTPGPTSR